MYLNSQTTSVGLPVAGLAPALGTDSAPTEPSAPLYKQNVVTITLEDYFQARAFQSLITPDQWYRFESRLVRNTTATLELLSAVQTRGTFFVSGALAAQFPELVGQIAAAGHEIADRGAEVRDPATLSRSEFADDLARSRAVLERVAGQRVVGYRSDAAGGGATGDWVWDVLAEQGYIYDASPEARSRRAVRATTRQREIAGLPVRDVLAFAPSALNLFGFEVPLSEGACLRGLPAWCRRRAIEYCRHGKIGPWVLHFCVWELDPDQPRITAAPPRVRAAHYRNLDKMRDILSVCLEGNHFGSVVDYLQLDLRRPRRIMPPAIQQRLGGVVRATEPVEQQVTEPKVPVTIVIPCYNEADVIPHLGQTLASVEAALSAEYAPQFVFVDDQSRDQTWTLLQQTFGNNHNCHLVRHERNQGVSAAIMTGIRAARTEIVCSIDCDCSYDPHELRQMLPLLAPDVDLVTASPYHAAGHVCNVARWRLGLSKTLSRLYRQVLPGKLATYTSCFRVYRKSSIAPLTLSEGGFLGTAELVGQLALAGRRIVEYPATLHVRMFGESKMKISRTILGHLRLLSRFVVQRAWGRSRGLSAFAVGRPQRRSAEFWKTNALQ